MSNLTKNHGEFKAFPTVKYTWRIENFSQHADFYSDPFMFEGYKWSLYAKPGCYSCVRVEEEASTPCGWFVDAIVTLTMTHDQLDHNNETQTMKTRFTFNTKDRECREPHDFFPLMPSEFLHDEQKGFPLNDTCIIEVELTVTNTSGGLTVDPIVELTVTNTSGGFTVDPITSIDYVLHSETMDSIHTQAQSFLKSLSTDGLLDDNKIVKLLEDAVETEEGIQEKLSKLRKRHTQELEAATKEVKDVVEQSFSKIVVDGIPGFCTHFDKFLKTQEGAIKEVEEIVRAKLDEIRRRSEKELGEARKEVQVLMEERVEAARRTQQLFHSIANQKVPTTTEDHDEWEEWVSE